MPQCAVATCRNSHRKTKGRRVRYHRFPAEDDVRGRWVAVCGRGTGVNAFNPATARVCSLHFSPNSYERDVEHELLGLAPRSRLRKGAVPDRAVPITLPSLIGKRRPARQQQVRRRRRQEEYVDEEDDPMRDPDGFDVLLALGLTPSAARRDLHDLNKMHAVADEDAVKQATPAVDAKTNGVEEVKENGIKEEHEEEAESQAAAATAAVTEKEPEEEEEAEEEEADEKTGLGSSAGSVAHEDVTVKTEELSPASPAHSSSSDSDTPSLVKRMRLTQAQYDEREAQVSACVESAAGASVDEVQHCADRLQQELDALAVMARAKEHEWNNILRLKKVKEEMLVRLQRKKQVMLIMMSRDTGEWEERGPKERPHKRPSAGTSLLKSNQHSSLMMVPIVSSSPGASGVTMSSRRPHRPILPKPPSTQVNGQNPVIGEGRQGPILDVRSIIADYRSRHPETVPRRGRRLKSSLSPSQLPENLVSSTRVSGGILSMANMALGSGSQMRAGVVGSSVDVNELGLMLESSRPSSADSSRSGAPPSSSISFKDVLVQFAKMSQIEQRLDHLPPANQPSKPPPYPDVTLHPVLSPPSPPSSSLLHGILTKSSGQQQQPQRADNNRPATFSPTLARLLTAPERAQPSAVAQHYRQGVAQVSISDLLSTSKQTRNEITITPVTAHQAVKPKQDVVLVEEEQEDSADRLVIDESGGGADAEAGQEVLAEDVPECQGCHQRTAQFVCAGCGNQWYCSRDCQVSAWDDHSDVCSG